MKNQFKLELGALGLFFVLLLLARMDILPNFLHLFYSVFVGFYFFPIRLAIYRPQNNVILYAFSSFIVAASISLISVVTVIGNDLKILVGALAGLASLNLVGTFYYYSKSNRNMGILHSATQFVLALYFF
jgi:hypothetical protein